MIKVMYVSAMKQPRNYCVLYLRALRPQHGHEICKEVEFMRLLTEVDYHIYNELTHMNEDYFII